LFVVALGANAGAAEAQNPNWLDGSNCRDYLTGLGAPAQIPHGDREAMAEAKRIIGYVNSVVVAGLIVYEESGSAPQALSNAALPLRKSAATQGASRREKRCRRKNGLRRCRSYWRSARKSLTACWPTCFRSNSHDS